MADSYHTGGLFGSGIYAYLDGQIPVWDAALQRFVPSTPAGGGDVVGPAGATNNDVVLFDGVTGKLIKDSGQTIAAIEAAAAATAVAALDDKTYLTASDETATLGNSRQLLAGTNVTFDDTTPGERTVNASSGGGATVYTSAFASPPASPAAGDLWLPSNSFYLLRYSGSAWVPWGPVFPMTAPDDTGFSWVNQGSASVVTTNGGICLVGQVDSTLNVRLRVKTAPSPPYTVTAYLMPRLLDINQHIAGICWRESGTGELGLFGIDTNGTGVLLDFNNMNSPTSFNSAPFSNLIGTIPSGIWLRLEDDNTNRKLHWSWDGVNFMQVYSVARTTFLTPNQVGFYVGDTSNTYVPAATLLSWKEA